MKSFTALALVASAALASAQVTTNPDGTFTCAIPNAAYCAGDSLSTNIIIRCIGTVGQPGNCDDNLDGSPPVGLSFAPCWQPSATSGQAACSKNCIVYGGSGNYNGTFTLPNCTPSTTVTASTSSVSIVSSVTASSAPVTSYTTIVTLGTTITVPCSSGSPIISSTPIPLSTVTASISSKPAGNTTVTTGKLSSISSTVTASTIATSAGSTSSKPATFSGAAVANQAGAVLAAGGMLMAYLL